MQTCSEISSLLTEWYAAHCRDLPWRSTRDPYKIWLSEVILQQTRVAQGLAYYERFIERFPDVWALAGAAEDEVMKLWQGLGYYSRAHNLHAAAKQVVERFGGAFPRTYEQVRALPGVGDYTAAAVCSIAYGLPYAVVDGNVCRVLARLYDIDLPVGSGEARKMFADLATRLLDPARPGLHNQAMMELGALVCTPVSPDCNGCPLSARCLALAAGSVAARPVKLPKRPPADRYFHFLHLRSGGKTVLSRRGTSDIWKNLYEFPLIEAERPLGWEEVQQTSLFRLWLTDAAKVTLRRVVPMPVHRLTHRTIHASFFEIEVPDLPDMPLLKNVAGAPATFMLVDDAAVGDYAIPRLIDRYLERSEK